MLHQNNKQYICKNLYPFFPLNKDLKISLNKDLKK